MPKTTDKGKRSRRGVKKLSLKKETVKDLDAGLGKELGDDQLDAVNGGMLIARISYGANVCDLQLKPEFPTRPACVAPTQPPTECIP